MTRTVGLTRSLSTLALAGCCAGLMAIMAPSAFGQTQLTLPSSAQSNAQRIDEMFSRWQGPDSPGVAVLVLQNGQAAFAKGYGMADIEHGITMTPRSLFDVASLSKQFCAMSIALLEAEGKLSLSDDARKYVPELANFGTVITIDHLIHHTSGLRDWPDALHMAGWNFEDVISYQQILRFAFSQRALNFVPGAEYTYSNTGYNILALIVERVSGQTFRQFTDARIFTPLGMTNTHFHDDHDDVIIGRAESYRAGAGTSVLKVPSNLTALGSSSLFTTAEDLARWVHNYESPTVGDARIIARLHERFVLTNGDTTTYAFGQIIENYRGFKRVSHSGSWAGFRVAIQRFPDQQFAVIVLSNTTAINPVSSATRIVDFYLGERMSPAQTPVVSNPAPATATYTPNPADMSAYVGRYESDELSTFWTVSVRNGALVASHFRAGDVEMRPLARDTFRAGVLGDIAFKRNATGRIEAFTASTARARNVRFDRVPERPAR